MNNMTDRMMGEAGSPDGEFLGPSVEEILSCIADAVISTDAEGKILLVNPAAEVIFGYRATEILGSNIEILIPTRSRSDHAAHLAGFSAAPGDVARKMAGERKVLGLRRDGSEFAAEAMLSCRHLEHITLLTVVIRDVSQRMAVEAQRELVVGEMAHRFGNIMAMVNSIVRLTGRSVSSVEEYRTRLEGRLHALLRNQEALTKPGGKVRLMALLEAELAPFRSAENHTIDLHGEDLVLQSTQSINLSLVIHELTTNALKYGALSQAGGCLQLSWLLEQDGDAHHLVLDWIEQGGPPVNPPADLGFGSTLIAHSFGPGNSRIDYNPEGLVARFRIELDQGAEGAPRDANPRLTLAHPKPAHL